MNPIQWAKAEVLHLAWKRGHWMPPDRRLMADKILPALAKSAEIKRVLSIGVAWYTKSYEAPFKEAGKTFMTIEIDPQRTEFGSSMKHVTGDVCDLEKLFADEEEPFDAILMNGVIGYGVNEVELVDKALKACAASLRKGGLLVIGVNEEKPTHVDPRDAPSSSLFTFHHDLFFAKWPDGRITVEVPFREKTHTFLFWAKR